MAASYRRRKIESNWEKYEEAASSESDDTEMSVHAGDYAQLLKATCVYCAMSFIGCTVMSAVTFRYICLKVKIAVSWQTPGVCSFYFGIM